MRWCTINVAGKIIMTGQAGDDAVEADFAPCGGSPLLNIPDAVQHDTHYVIGDVFYEFGQKPSDYHVWDWTTHAWRLSDTALDTAKETQAVLLDTVCRETIILGFDSSALGSNHHYPAKITDQSNLVASVTASLYPDLPVDWTTPFWCEVDGNWSYELHTANQIQQVGAAGKVAILECLAHNALRQNQIQNATSITEVQEIVW